MADHSPTGPVETGAQMDYPEHEKTYKTFISLAKYVSLLCFALLVVEFVFRFDQLLRSGPHRRSEATSVG